MAIKIQNQDGTVTVTGTYDEVSPHRAALKRRGFFWDSVKRVWYLPPERGPKTPAEKQRLDKFLAKLQGGSGAAPASNHNWEAENRRIWSSAGTIYGFSIQNMSGGALVSGFTLALKDAFRAAGADWVDQFSGYLLPYKTIDPVKSEKLLETIQKHSALRERQRDQCKSLWRAVPNKLYGFKVVDTPNGKLVSGDTYVLRSLFGAAGGEWSASDKAYRINHSVADPDKLKVLLKKMQAISDSNEVKIQNVKKALADSVTSFPLLKITVNMAGSTVTLEGDTYDYKGVIQKHLPEVRWKGAWVIAAEDIDTPSLKKLLGFLEGEETKLREKIEADRASGLPFVPKGRPNSRRENCKRCGGVVDPGEGVLVSEYDDDRDRNVWVVYHKDPRVCVQTLKDRKERRERESIIRITHSNAVKKLREHSLKHGRYEAGKHRLQGNILYIDGRSSVIYGGGEWVQIEPSGDYFWYVINNGSDGDNWSRNNVVTGGAGAIGYRVKMTDELRALIEVAKE